MSDIKPGERRVYLSWIYYALLSVRQSLRRLYELILLAVYDTPEAVQNFEASFKTVRAKPKRRKNTMAQNKIRVRLKSYDSTIIDAAAAKVVEVAKRNGSKVSGPIPLPTDKEIITILRAVHKYKDSREQFEMRTHKRLIDVIDPQQKTIEALMGIELPAGVEIEIKA